MSKITGHRGSTELVQKYIGTAYDDVRKVAEQIEGIKTLSEIVESSADFAAMASVITLLGDSVSDLAALASADLAAISADLTKGNYLGNRKIDIDLQLNNNSELVEVSYSGVTITTNEGNTLEINFETDAGDTQELTSYTAIYNFITSGISDYNASESDAQKHIVNTEIDIINSTLDTLPTILRFRDTDGSASNIDRVELHVHSGDFVEENPAYFWANTTSALQTLANRVGDVIALGNDIDSIIALASQTDEVGYLYEARDALTGDTDSVYSELDKLKVLYEDLSHIITVANNVNEVVSLGSRSEAIDAIYENVEHLANTADNVILTASNAEAAQKSADDALTILESIEKVHVENTSTGASGESAVVTFNSNTGALNFVIPKGDKGDKGDSFEVSAIGKYEDIGLYDNQALGFNFLAVDQSLIYFKLSSTSGDWSEGSAFGKGDTGEKGEQGEQGLAPEHEWGDDVSRPSTELRFQNADLSWGESVDLKGDKGDKGETGEQGIQGNQGDKGDFSLAGSRNSVLNQEAVSIESFIENGYAVTELVGTGAGQVVDLGLDLSNDCGYLIQGKNLDSETDHWTIDSTRGLFKKISLNSATEIEKDTASHISSLTSSGLILGGHNEVNPNNDRFVVECFKLTHKTEGTTNHGKPYTTHYNPYLGKSVTLFEMSPDVGHIVPTHLGGFADKITMMPLDKVGGANVKSKHLDEDEYLQAHSANGIITSIFTQIVDGGIQFQDNEYWNDEGQRVLMITDVAVEEFSDFGIHLGTGSLGAEIKTGFPVAKYVNKGLSANGLHWDSYFSTGDSDSDVIVLNEAIGDISQNNIVTLSDSGIQIHVTNIYNNNINYKYFYEAYARSSEKDSVLATTSFNKPTTTTLTLNENTLISYANGFSGTAPIDLFEVIPENTTFDIPDGYANKELYLFKDYDNSYGVTDIKPLEGLNRSAADTWGQESTDGLRKPETHSDYVSNTGAISSSSYFDSLVEFSAFDVLSGNTGEGDCWVSGRESFSTTTGLPLLRDSENLTYLFSEKRCVKSLRIRERGHSTNNSVRDWTIQTTSDGGTTWEVIGSYTDEEWAGEGLWRDLKTFDSDVSYDGIRIDVTKVTGINGFVSIGEIEVNTSAPKGDFYNIQDGITYDQDDTPLTGRVYLSKLTTDSNGDVTTIDNFPVAREAVNDLTVHGLLNTKGNVQIRNIGTIHSGNRYVLDNPFGNDKAASCSVRAEVLHNGIWSETGWGDHSSISSYGFGTKAFSNSEGLVIQTGISGVLRRAASLAGGGHGDTEHVTLGSAPCRLIVTYYGDATNA